MKPSNSGIPISLAVLCLLFQNVSSISQQEQLPIRDGEAENSLQNFFKSSLKQQEQLPIRDGEAENSLQNISESSLKERSLEFLHLLPLITHINIQTPISFQEQERSLKLPHSLSVITRLNFHQSISFQEQQQERLPIRDGEAENSLQNISESSLEERSLESLHLLPFITHIDIHTSISSQEQEGLLKLLHSLSDLTSLNFHESISFQEQERILEFPHLRSVITRSDFHTPISFQEQERILEFPHLCSVITRSDFHTPISFQEQLFGEWIIYVEEDDSLQNVRENSLQTNVLEIGELLRSSEFRVGISLLIYVLFMSSAIIRSSISNNASRLEDPFSTLVDCLKKNIMTSTNQEQKSMCDEFTDWSLYHFIVFLFLLVVMSLTFSFLLPCIGIYFIASNMLARDVWLLNCLTCSHGNVFTSEYLIAKSEDLTMLIYTAFLYLLSSSLCNIFRELEKLRKHFTHWQVMWAVAWILLLAFLYYISQNNNNVYGICSYKVSEMILALPIKKLLVLLFVLIMSTGSASAFTYCAENQTAEIDAQGMINCNFPDNFYRVVWFDDVSESSSFAISCGAPCSVKKGPGFRSKYYDIFQNGSLWIPRVTVQHERPFEVFVYTSQDHFEKQTIYLKVIARPGQRLPTLDYNGTTQYHYHKVKGKANLTCSFNATRPPVQLTWLQRTDEGDVQVKQQEKTVFENEDGTFNSYVTIDLTTTPMESRMLLFVCKANWTLQGWEKEKEILLDNRDLQSFDGEPNKTLYLEQGRQANVRCKGSNGFLQLWEKTSSNNGPVMIGYTANGLTRAVATSQDPTISSEGHLIFSSPQVDDEGIYVCAYSHDMRNEVYVVAVTILIAPLPPSIHIKGCKDDNHACSLKAYDQGQLSCFVMDVRPSVSLEWIASDVRKIALHASKEITKEHGTTSDTELSVEYELISENIKCGDNVYVTCRLNGPVSHITKHERTVKINTSEPCRPVEDKGDGFSKVPMIVIIPCSILALGLCISVMLFCKCCLKRKVASGSHSNMAAEHSIPMNDIENGN